MVSEVVVLETSVKGYIVILNDGTIVGTPAGQNGRQLAEIQARMEVKTDVNLIKMKEEIRTDGEEMKEAVRNGRQPKGDHNRNKGMEKREDGLPRSDGGP
jgi:hypothetical protein